MCQSHRLIKPNMAAMCIILVCGNEMFFFYRFFANSYFVIYRDTGPHLGKNFRWRASTSCCWKFWVRKKFTYSKKWRISTLFSSILCCHWLVIVLLEKWRICDTFARNFGMEGGHGPTRSQIRPCRDITSIYISSCVIS